SAASTSRVLMVASARRRSASSRPAGASTRDITVSIGFASFIAFFPDVESAVFKGGGGSGCVAQAAGHVAHGGEPLRVDRVDPRILPASVDTVIDLPHLLQG